MSPSPVLRPVRRDEFITSLADGVSLILCPLSDYAGQLSELDEGQAVYSVLDALLRAAQARIKTLTDAVDSGVGRIMLAKSEYDPCSFRAAHLEPKGVRHG